MHIIIIIIIIIVIIILRGFYRVWRVWLAERKTSLPLTPSLQRDLMLEDIEKHKYHETGFYRNIKWAINRHTEMKHLCGYVLDNDHISDETIEKLDSIAHGGLTARLGFECAHYGDYISFDGDPLWRGCYRNYDYVLGIIHKMIDCILEERN